MPKRKPGRPPIYSEPLIHKSLGLPARTWAKYDAEARRRSVREKRAVSASEVIREKL